MASFASLPPLLAGGETVLNMNIHECMLLFNLLNESGALFEKYRPHN
jgi:hypothetical protein